MSQLTLQWVEHGQPRQYVINAQAATQVPGRTRIGRDPVRCDLVLSDSSVSGLHVEIVWQPQQQQFLLRNLRDSNPPIVDGQLVQQGEVPLGAGSQIQLGRITVRVEQARTPALAHPAAVPPGAIAAPAYGLLCPNLKCQKVIPYDHQHLQTGCPWCGYTLAAAQSVILPVRV